MPIYTILIILETTFGLLVMVVFSILTMQQIVLQNECSELQEQISGDLDQDLRMEILCWEELIIMEHY